MWPSKLMDRKLAEFFARVRTDDSLDDTLLILVSDHGEAFGDHGLFLHDASVYETHLHVPLWIHHPAIGAGAVDDVVSTRHLFGLMRAAARGSRIDDTLLDPEFRANHPIALAEHFYYPRIRRMAPQYRQNLTAAVSATHKVIIRSDGTQVFDLGADAAEQCPLPIEAGDFASTLRATGVSCREAERTMSYLAAASA
jgi:arylsulfatase A-like enzyme